MVAFLLFFSIVYLGIKGGELLKFLARAGMCECQGCWCPTGASRREGDIDRSPVLHQSQYNAAVYHQGWEEREGEEEEERGN